MDGKYLLDTNIVIRLFAGDKRVVHFLNEFSNAYVPCIVLGELFYGAQKSLNIEKNTAKIQEFSHSAIILPCEGEAGKMGRGIGKAFQIYIHKSEISNSLCHFRYVV